MTEKKTESLSSQAKHALEQAKPSIGQLMEVPPEETKLPTGTDEARTALAIAAVSATPDSLRRLLTVSKSPSSQSVSTSTSPLSPPSTSLIIAQIKSQLSEVTQGLVANKQAIDKTMQKVSQNLRATEALLHEQQGIHETSVSVATSDEPPPRSSSSNQRKSRKPIASQRQKAEEELVIADGIRLGKSKHQKHAAKTIRIGNNVTMDDSCFQGVKAKNIFIGHNVSTGASCFQGCRSLSSVIIGDNASIGISSFQACPVLSYVSLGKNPKIGSSVPKIFAR